MVSGVQDSRIYISFNLNFLFPSSHSSSVPVQRETQDSSPCKKDICFGWWLGGGQEEALEDACHAVVDNKSRGKFN